MTQVAAKLRPNSGIFTRAEIATLGSMSAQVGVQLTPRTHSYCQPNNHLEQNLSLSLT